MSNYRIAVRYAKSLLELALETGKLGVVKKDIDMLFNICREKDFSNFLKNPIIDNYRKLAILKNIFKGRIDELTFGFINIVTSKSREDILPEITEQFLVQYRQHKKIEIVEVLTSVELDQSMRKEFEEFAKDHVGKGWTVEINEKVKKDLIGGFIVKIGDKQIDNSISSKLREIRKKLIVS